MGAVERKVDGRLECQVVRRVSRSYRVVIRVMNRYDEPILRTFFFMGENQLDDLISELARCLGYHVSLRRRTQPNIWCCRTSKKTVGRLSLVQISFRTRTAPGAASSEFNLEITARSAQSLLESLAEPGGWRLFG